MGSRSGCGRRLVRAGDKHPVDVHDDEQAAFEPMHAPGHSSPYRIKVNGIFFEVIVV
jgi:hypothetical protein